MPALLEQASVQKEETPPNLAPPTHDAVELRAYFRYVGRGRMDGCALEDWLAAEEGLRRDSEAPPT